MKIVDEIIKCRLCDDLYDEPILLTCCSESICKKHIDSDAKKYICYFCDQEHDLSKNKFPINKTLVKLLKAEFDKLEFGNAYDNARKFCSELDSLIAKFKKTLKDPAGCIHDHVSNIKMKIDLRREEFKLKIDNICEDMITKLESFEKACVENTSNSSLETIYKSKFDKIKKEFDLENSIQDFNLLKIDKTKWDLNLSLAAVQKNQIENLTKSLNKDMLMNTSCEFNKNLDFEQFCANYYNELSLEKCDYDLITLHIDHFSMFSFRETKAIRSDFATNGKFKFCIKTKMTLNEDDKEFYLGFFLECECNEQKNLPVTVSAKLSMVNLKNSENNLVASKLFKILFQDLEHKYEENESYGYPKFVKSKTIMSEEKGFYNKEKDRISLFLQLTIKD